MLVMRLRRIGKKNKPSYRVVVSEHTTPVSGSFVEDLGFYNPHTKSVGLNKESVEKWLSHGVRPSNSVARLLQTEKVKHPLVVVVKKNKQAKKTEEKAEAVPAAAPAAEAEAPGATDSVEALAEETAVEPTDETPAETETTESEQAEEPAAA